jgi:hypothetical protein
MGLFGAVTQVDDEGLNRTGTDRWEPVAIQQECNGVVRCVLKRMNQK